MAMEKMACGLYGCKPLGIGLGFVVPWLLHLTSITLTLQLGMSAHHLFFTPR